MAAASGTWWRRACGAASPCCSCGKSPWRSPPSWRRPGSFRPCAGTITFPSSSMTTWTSLWPWTPTASTWARATWRPWTSGGSWGRTRSSACPPRRWSRLCWRKSTGPTIWGWGRCSPPAPRTMPTTCPTTPCRPSAGPCPSLWWPSAASASAMCLSFPAAASAASPLSAPSTARRTSAGHRRT